MANNESIVNFNAEKIAEHVALLAVPDCMSKCNPFDVAHMQRCLMIDLHAFFVWVLIKISLLYIVTFRLTFCACTATPQPPTPTLRLLPPTKPA